MGQKVRYHPAANLLPEISDDERWAGFKEDIRERGVLKKVVFWTDQNDPKKTRWLIDGRNRHRAVEELRREGLKIDLPEEEFTGTAEEVFWFVNSSNLAGRRNLTSSQAACVAVRLRRFAEEHGHRLPVAGTAAETLGTNRAYYFAAQRLLEQSPVLFDRVADGEFTLPFAQNMLEKAKPAKTAPEPAKAAPEVAPAPEEAAPQAFDPKPHAAEKTALDFRHLFDEAVSLAEQAARRVDAIADAGADGWMDRKDVQQMLEAVCTSLKWSRPASDCPDCGAAGEFGDGSRCKACEGKGYLSAARQQALAQAAAS